MSKLLGVEEQEETKISEFMSIYCRPFLELDRVYGAAVDFFRKRTKINSVPGVLYFQDFPKIS